MALSDGDKKAAKALIKLGILDREEVLEWIEGLEEIDYDDGLLGLLEDEERITAAEREKVEKLLAGAPGGAGKEPRSAGKKRAARKERPRRPSSRREEAEPRKKGFPLLLVGGGAAALVVALVVVVALVAGGGSGPARSDGDGPGTGDGGEPAEDGPAEPGARPGSGTPGPGSGGPSDKPRPRTVHRFAYKFEEDMRVAYNVLTETVNTAGGERLETREDRNVFFCSLEARDGLPMCSVEHQIGTTTKQGNRDPDRAQLNYVEFLLLKPDGSTDSERRMGAELFSWYLTEPRFPVDGEVHDGTWSLDFDTREGRFEFVYTVGEEDVVDGKDCRKISVQGRFPGGAPPSSFAIRKAEGTVWFDKTRGVIAKAEAVLETAPAEGGEEAESTLEVKVTRTLMAKERIELDARKDIQNASKFYFEVLEKIDQGAYNGAYKMLMADELPLSTKYIEVLVPDLMKRIPGIRMSLQAQIAMRKRQQRTFRGLPWRRPEHGPAMFTGEPETTAAKERTLDLVGKRAPDWVTKKLKKDEKGKPALVYVGFNWLGPTHSAARMANAIATANKGRVAVFGIVNAHSWRDQIRFFAGVRRLQHRVHWVREHTIRDWKLTGCPAILVLDGSGTVVYACVGFFPDKTEEAVKKALGV